MEWDEAADFVVVGSGAGAMAGAVVAHECGASALVLEKTDRYGGTTALSGGVVWIPNNDGMRAAGIPDSDEEALSYLGQLVGDTVPAARLASYVREGVAMVRFFESHTSLRFMAAERYADYYPELPGGKHGGRSMEPVPISLYRLGAEWTRMRWPDYLTGFLRFSVTVKESRAMMDMSLAGYFAIARRILAHYLDLPSRLRGLPNRRLTLGRALIAHCRLALLERGIPLWLDTEVCELVVQQQRVVGVVARRDGRMLRIAARRGVLLAAGGMGHAIAMRTAHGQLPGGEGFSSAAPGDTGDAIRMGTAIGADLGFMDCAWWTPSVRRPDGAMAALISGKAMPGSIFVDATGRRYCNEAAPYEDVIKAQWANHRRGNPSVPAWMIFDARYRHQYPVGLLPPGKIQNDARMPPEYRKCGFLHRADSIAALAALIGVDGPALADSVERHNGFARNGKDLDFGRGDSLSDRYYSDPAIGPNPNLAPIVAAPFYAIAIYPGDLGTKGGLQCDEFARVLREDGSVIEGLYAAGNSSASVMGDTYPGAGATIGPSMTFSYVAARHACAGQTAAENSP
jgi:3-oxosteroid 1-dehydrogenase